MAVSDVEKVLQIIGDTPENRAKLREIVAELGDEMKEALGVVEKAKAAADGGTPEDEEEKKKAAKKPEEEVPEEEAEQEKKAAKKPEDKKPWEEETPEEEKAEDPTVSLLGTIRQKLTDLQDKVEGPLKTEVADILKLVGSLKTKYPYPKPAGEAKPPTAAGAPYPEAKELVQAQQRMDAMDQKLAAMAEQVGSIAEFSTQLKELMGSVPKSSVRPSQGATVTVSPDDPTVIALKSVGKSGGVLPGFIGFRNE